MKSIAQPGTLCNGSGAFGCPIYQANLPDRLNFGW